MTSWLCYLQGDSGPHLQTATEAEIKHKIVSLNVLKKYIKKTHNYSEILMLLIYKILINAFSFTLYGSMIMTIITENQYQIN